MPLLLLFLLLFFLAPWLGVILFFFVILFFLVFIPLGFAAQSFLWLFIGPTQLFKVLFNRRVRRNHALEHATVHVLEENIGKSNISGMAYENGFSLKGVVEPDAVLEAARMGLARMKRGEWQLAVHSRCGTTIVVVNMLSSLIFILILYISGYLGISTVILALLLAHLLGPVSSRFVQRYVTTAQDVGRLEISGVEIRSNPVHVMGMRILVPDSIFVSTREEDDAVIPEVIY